MVILFVQLILSIRLQIHISKTSVVCLSPCMLVFIVYNFHIVFLQTAV